MEQERLPESSICGKEGCSVQEGDGCELFNAKEKKEYVCPGQEAENHIKELTELSDHGLR